jgi:hypothetical protein
MQFLGKAEFSVLSTFLNSQLDLGYHPERVFSAFSTKYKLSVQHIFGEIML